MHDNTATPAPAPTPAPPPPKNFTLLPLPYAYNALEPAIDNQTVFIHHERHERAYVDNLNAALQPYPELLVAPSAFPVPRCCFESIQVATHGCVGFWDRKVQEVGVTEVRKYQPCPILAVCSFSRVTEVLTNSKSIGTLSRAGQYSAVMLINCEFCHVVVSVTEVSCFAV